MAYGRISKKQQEILDYIKNEILNRGFPPAVRENLRGCPSEIYILCSFSSGSSGKERLHP